MSAERLLIVGNRGGTNVGGSFEQAAVALGIDVSVMESRAAMRAPAWRRWVSWRLQGRRPPRLEAFSREVAAQCAESRPTILLTTGFAPLTLDALDEIAKTGCRTLNYLTDDPWNRAQWAPWFLEALPRYTTVFTTRTANLEELRQLGCGNVQYMPFAYDPKLFFPEKAPHDEGRFFESDIFFAGAADADRIPYIDALRKAGFKLALYGSYWNRYPSVIGFSRGQADAKTLRSAIGGCKVALCLVRRANRDGHSMRTFEVPAVGACLLVEETDEHKAIFGREDESVCYFRTAEEMVEKLRGLLTDPERRARLANAAHKRIVSGRNTYADRLLSMLAC